MDAAWGCCSVTHGIPKEVSCLQYWALASSHFVWQLTLVWVFAAFAVGIRLAGLSHIPVWTEVTEQVSSQLTLFAFTGRGGTRGNFPLALSRSVEATCILGVLPHLWAPSWCEQCCQTCPVLGGLWQSPFQPEPFGPSLSKRASWIPWLQFCCTRAGELLASCTLSCHVQNENFYSSSRPSCLCLQSTAEIVSLWGVLSADFLPELILDPVLLEFMRWKQWVL